MSVHPSPKNLARDVVRQVWPKRQPRRPRPKNPGEAKTRALLAERSGGWCEASGLVRAQSVHHRRKRSQGGPWTASNCVHVCGDGTRGCHGWAEANPVQAGADGFSLRNGEDPARTPIVSGLHGHVLIADDGSIRPAGGAA